MEIYQITVRPTRMYKQIVSLQPTIRIYDIPNDTFESDEDADESSEEEDDDEDEDEEDEKEDQEKSTKGEGVYFKISV